MSQPVTLRQQWESFVCLTLPIDISDAQLETTRRAFYAGAAALWGVFEQADATGEPESFVLHRVQAEMRGQAEERTGARVPKKGRGRNGR